MLFFPDTKIDGLEVDFLINDFLVDAEDEEAQGTPIDFPDWIQYQIDCAQEDGIHSSDEAYFLAHLMETREAIRSFRKAHFPAERKPDPFVGMAIWH